MELTVRQVATLLGVAEKSVYRWILHANMPAHQVSGQYRLNREELLEWVTNQGEDFAQKLSLAVPVTNKHLPELSQAMKLGGIHRGLIGSDKHSVFSSMVAILPIPNEFDRQALFKIILARENLGSTAIGGGIALPHVRSPIIFSNAEPSVSLCYLAQGIDLKAPDHIPVTILFAVMSPTVPVHLHLVSRIASALRDPQFKSTVVNRCTDELIYAEITRIESQLGNPAFIHKV